MRTEHEIRDERRPGEIDTPFSRALNDLIAQHRDESNWAIIAALQMASVWLQQQCDGPEIN